MKRASCCSDLPLVEHLARTMIPPRLQRAAVLHSYDQVQSQKETSRPVPRWGTRTRHHPGLRWTTTCPGLQAQHRASPPGFRPKTPPPLTQDQGPAARATGAPRRACRPRRGTQRLPPPSLAKLPSAAGACACSPTALWKSLAQPLTSKSAIPSSNTSSTS